jgi:hypothetical protein
MAIPNGDSTALRSAIQAATSGTQIDLTGGPNPFSVTTLAKFPCFDPLERTDNYAIAGPAATRTAIIQNTRIYQQNIDGPYGPNVVKDLTLNYTSAAINNTAILRATTGIRTLDNLAITGQHSGWAGNGGVYMSMATSNGFNPISTDLTLSNSTIAVSGQVGTAAFMQSWNNAGTVNLTNNTFNEAGLNRGSFHFATMYPGGVVGDGTYGTYNVTGNTFNGNNTTKSNCNRVESVQEANIIDNTFNSGSYIDLAGDISGVKIQTTTFNTILNGPGIRFTLNSSSGAVLDTTMSPTISGNAFTGYGLAVTYNDSPSPVIATHVTFLGVNNTVKAGDLAVRTFGRMSAGGSLGDSLLGSGAIADWMNGGGGDDTLNAGNGSDYVIGGIGSDRIITGSGQDTMLYYETNEGGDTITDFAANNDKLAFRKDAFVPLGSTGTLPNANFSTNAAAITTVPTFLYTGGVLTYDADGLNTGAAGVNIATFNPTVPVLTAANIVLF